MGNRGKRYKASVGNVDHAKRYDVEEAFTVLKSFKTAKFNESVDVAIKLGVDPKQSDQMVRGVVRMPHGTGKKLRILVFAKGDKEQEAKDAGADYVGAEDLVEKIKGGWLEFDKAIATPDMMAKIGPVAKILGPRGLMPNPKVGTVTKDVGKAVTDQKAGSVEFRVEKAGIVHAPIGRMSFEAQQLKENFVVLVEQIIRAKPPSAKGVYLQSISVAATMSPSVKIDAARLQAAIAKTA